MLLCEIVLNAMSRINENDSHFPSRQLGKDSFCSQANKKHNKKWSDGNDRSSFVFYLSIEINIFSLSIKSLQKPCIMLF